MKACVVLVCVALFLGIVPVTAQDNPAYIYYYSAEHQAFVIEQAEGGNIRNVLSVPGDPDTVFSGAGWSPDGQWFAWHRRYPAVGELNAAIVNPTVGELIDRPISLLNGIQAMRWSPNGRLLLVDGQRCPPEACYDVIYWLVDVEAGLVVASLYFRPEAGGAGYYAPYEWLQNDDGVVFYKTDSLSGSAPGRTRITMYTDGRVHKELISEEEWDAVHIRVQVDEEIPERFVSPQGRYIVDGRAQTITDSETNTIIPIPMSELSENKQLFDVQWHSSEEWALVTYRLREAYYMTSLVKLDGTSQRDICFCRSGGVRLGWLPDNVNVDSIPLLADTP